jgi:DNA mismatch repair ATPase MutS
LARIVDTANARRSSLAHFPLVTLFVWDVHVLHAMEKWYAVHANAALGWVRTVGELEVLAALGGLRYDHPGWSFPEFHGDASSGIHARAMGHPLLRPEKCVRNDVEVPPPGQLLLVTGSNMAGKTTLLRSIGLNQVLALMGGPVTATELWTRPLLPWCTMRVRDSIEGGVSYFLAELQSLKRVVDAARAGPVLYLLDELLQGTNSAERRTAARIILGNLVRTGAVGAVTTHDLRLAASPELEQRSVNVHFREDVIETNGTRTLAFDYQLRPGPATSRNALLLLEIVGLEAEGDELESGESDDD